MFQKNISDENFALFDDGDDLGPSVKWGFMEDNHSAFFGIPYHKHHVGANGMVLRFKAI